MSETPRPGSGGRRRHNTRRLLRHPSRLAAKASVDPDFVSEVTPTGSQRSAADRAALAAAGFTNGAEVPSALANGDAFVAEKAADADAAAAQAEQDAEVEARTGKLDRPVDEPAADAAGSDVRSPSDVDAVLDEIVSVSPDAGSESALEAEAKTKPKIRLSDAAARRLSPPPNAPRDPLFADAPTRRQPSIPPLAGPLDALPTVQRTPLPPIPSGEGIVRNSIPPRNSVLDADRRARRDSDVPTRPRIPLTQDMAMAAGRITSQEVAPYRSSEEGPIRARTPYQNSGAPQAVEGTPPSVIVARAHVISDTPPANDRADSTPARRGRRSRPDSEEFETLDLDDEDTDEMSRLELDMHTADSRELTEPQVRVSRTPPPPPAHHTPSASRDTKRGPITGQHAGGSGGGSQRAAPPPPPPSAPQRRNTVSTRKGGSRKRAWWEVLFSDDYIRTLPKVSQAAVQKQVNFMEASLGIKRGDSVLDVGCGLGHHALELARRGYLTVGLDLALSMITRAAEEAQQRGLRINFLHKDIRDIGFEGTFDAVVCVGTTFGFFDDEQNKSVLQRLAHALKPGGRLLLDVVNRDFVINYQPNLVWFEGDGCVVMEESDFNFYSSRLNVKRTMMRDDGRQTDIDYNIRLYSVHELGQLLKQCGFIIREVSGQEATRGCFFGAHSGRIVLLAERRPFTRTQGGDEGAPPPAPPANGVEH